jgi:hypothetical protein
MAGKEAYLEFDGVSLLFDCVTTEQTDHTASVTEHPVEDGANVADHIRDNLDEITLEVMISNTPVRDLNNLYDGQVAGLELKVPRFAKPIAPTPGSLMTAGLNALGNLLNPDEAVKAVVLQFPEKFNHVQYVLSTLLDWKKQGVIGKVITPHRTYPSMAITRVSMTRNGATGDGAPITIDLKEVRLVESKLVTAPIPTEERGKIMKAKGRQPTSFVRDPAPKKSLLSKLLGG